MNKISIIISSILLAINVFGQDCPLLISPIDGATNVSVDATISWEKIEGVPAYIISIGTIPGGSDIISSQTSINSFTPPLGLPDDTQIYVTITLFFFDMPNIVCSSKSFKTENITLPPNCTTLLNPINGATNVNVAANISWNYVSGADGYLITIGTSLGLGDLVNNFDIGNALIYNSGLNFPPLTQIYVMILPYNENGNLNNCTEESFITGDVAALPLCTQMVTPFDGETNIQLSPLLQWEAVLGATAYEVYVGRSPFENDVLDGGIFTNNFTFVINFEPNNVYFVRIIPFNQDGEAIGCGQESFSTILGCGPFYDAETGELVTLNPVINFPDEVGICTGEATTKITATDEADGFRWYFIDDNDELQLLSSEPQVEISIVGDYLYEAYNIAYQGDKEIECSSTKEFYVVPSEAPIITQVNVNELTDGLEIVIQASGNGNYEYSVESADGPYQDSNVFNKSSKDVSTVYVRDKNGCGVTEYDIIGLGRFPKFFTPNGDGFHDYWKYNVKDDDDSMIVSIYIFDRFGKLIKQINPNGGGWDGTINGNRLPVSDYWYKALTSNGMVFTGHFTLKR